MTTTKEFVAQRFSQPHIADYMASLSPEQRAVFNQGKDCALAIIATWLSEGGELSPDAIVSLDEAISNAVGFDRYGFTLDEMESQ
jgi:hypothetical protein